MLKNRVFIDSKTAFAIAVTVIAVTVLSVWIFGFRSHRTVIENCQLSIATLSVAFFIFLFVSLYRGAKLKDSVGNITDRFDTKKLSKVTEIGTIDELPDAGEGIEGLIAGFVLWIVFTITFWVLLWVFGAVIWFSVLVFMAMLYWIFFRATRLALKSSAKCKGQFDYSIGYAFGYTVLYTSGFLRSFT